MPSIGCLMNLSEPMIKLCGKNGNECKVCTGSNCNSRASFIKCLKCHITPDDRQCAINPQLAESVMCKNYDDQCFTFIERFNVSRGCGGHPFITACQADPNKCEVCDTFDENGCNNRIITMETCVECDSLIDKQCHEEPHLFKDKVCSGLKTIDRLGCYLSVVSYIDSYIIIFKDIKWPVLT